MTEPNAMRTYTRLCLVLMLVAGVAADVRADGRELPPGWTEGPITGELGTVATVSLPEGYLFLDAAATARFLEENENIPDGDELGTIVHVQGDEHWFAVFSYADTGHVMDDDRDEIDADDLMATMKEGSESANEERAQRGWTPLVLDGWHQPPFYDLETRNLTWSTRLSSDGHPVINHSVRLLGRTGVMNVQLVADPDHINWATADFDDTIAGFSFVSGQQYSEFRQGDKLAGYGLTALIAGGAAAAAVKTGIFKKLGKLIVVAFVAVAAALRSLFRALFGRKAQEAHEAR